MCCLNIFYDVINLTMLRRQTMEQQKHPYSVVMLGLLQCGCKEETTAGNASLFGTLRVPARGKHMKVFF